MKDKIQLVCIVCPNGCLLDIEREDGNIVSVQGATCNKGEVYARNELLNPMRSLTTTIKVKGGQLPLVSVRSEREIPKNKIIEAANFLRGIEIKAPVAYHQVIVKDILGTGVDVIATREVKKCK